VSLMRLLKRVLQRWDPGEVGSCTPTGRGVRHSACVRSSRTRLRWNHRETHTFAGFELYCGFPCILWICLTLAAGEEEGTWRVITSGCNLPVSCFEPAPKHPLASCWHAFCDLLSYGATCSLAFHVQPVSA